MAFVSSLTACSRSEQVGQSSVGGSCNDQGLSGWLWAGGRGRRGGAELWAWRQPDGVQGRGWPCWAPGEPIHEKRGHSDRLPHVSPDATLALLPSESLHQVLVVLLKCPA